MAINGYCELRCDNTAGSAVQRYGIYRCFVRINFLMGILTCFFLPLLLNILLALCANVVVYRKLAVFSYITQFWIYRPRNDDPVVCRYVGNFMLLLFCKTQINCQLFTGKGPPRDRCDGLAGRAVHYYCWRLWYGKTSNMKNASFIVRICIHTDYFSFIQINGINFTQTNLWTMFN